MCAPGSSAAAGFALNQQGRRQQRWRMQAPAAAAPPLKPGVVFAQNFSLFQGKLGMTGEKTPALAMSLLTQNGLRRGGSRVKRLENFPHL